MPINHLRYRKKPMEECSMTIAPTNKCKERKMEKENR
jgi:hypothetical protein